MLKILDFFPRNIANFLYESIHEEFHQLEEIRLRVGKPIILKFSNKEEILDYQIARRRNIKDFATYMR